MPDAIKVGDSTVQPGERAFGYLHIGYLAGGTKYASPIR